MSRVTPPVQTLTRSVRRISSTAVAARPSEILNSQARNAYLPRSKVDLQTECTKRQLKPNGSKIELVERLAASDYLINRHGYHTSVSSGHRPQSSTTAPLYRIVPLMQGFRSSAPRPIRGDTSTIESFIFPETPEAPPVNPFERLRVPLLPDNYNPDRSSFVEEEIDGAMPKNEISIVAASPETVTPVAMSEVVGNDGLDVDIGQLTQGFSDTTVESKEVGALKELFSGMVDDIFGKKGKVAYK
ncbi:hypothetical protein BJ875DRAFT_141544 [Amylocarpus encephaloides]|uniref:SAP domain-containing protein n=1 Tax=Amylocarpus encephaloides TaxID=45428 RepID=A0A9P7YR14_9HELO|nr:hypothetical protein BJ875DRAFT_141544 [Amylocarpus encephaloides]